MTRKFLLTTILVAMLGGAAGAQTAGQRIVIERPSPAARQEGMVRIQLSIQMFIAGPIDDSEEAEKGRTRARNLIYDLASKECDLMRQVIASTCRLENVNINFNRQIRQSSQTEQGYGVNGQMSFQIGLK